MIEPASQRTSHAPVLLALHQVTKRWGAASGLEPVTAQLRRNEIVALQGRSGSGKSTLLALLAGWCEPDGGRIERIGTWGAGDAWQQWRATAIVPQVLGLAGELSVQENVEHVLRLARVDRALRRAAVGDVLDLLDLTELAARLPRELSLGQQQRVAVARAVVASPVVLLADEPTCHQDPAHADGVFAALRTVADAGGTVLVASHDTLVAAASDRVVSLDD